MRILKIISAKVDKVGNGGYTRFTIKLEDGTKLTKLEEYNKYIINNCYLTRTYNEFDSLDNLVNSVLVFNTKKNRKYVNIEENYSANLIVEEIKDKILKKEYSEFEGFYFDALKYFVENKSYTQYLVNDMLITKILDTCVIYDSKYFKEEIVHAFNIEQLYIKYFKNITYTYKDGKYTEKSYIHLSKAKITTTIRNTKEKHLKFVTTYTDIVLVKIGMSISEAIKQSNRIKFNED